MAQTVQPEVFVNYISQRKKIVVNAHNQPTQLLIQTDYNLNDTLYFQVINVNNRIVELDVNTTYQLYGTYIDAKKQVHVLFYTLGVTPRDNMLSFLVNTYTSEYLAYVKNNRTPIDISIVAKQNVGGSTKSYMVLRDSALANPRGYIEGQAPTDIVYQNVFNSQIPVSTAFGAGNDINLIQDLEGQEIYSFAFGDTLSTNNANQFVIGYSNTPDATKAFIVANSGNIFTVDYEGNVEANSISTTSLYINGEEIGQAVDVKVDQLSTAFDDKLSATEDWVSDTFETKESATQTFNELEQDIDSISSFVSGLPTDIAAKADQTDLDEANGKIDTISGQVEYLSGAIDQHTSDIGDLNNAVSAKANQTDLEALSTTVEGLAETKADLSSVYTKEEVYTYIETDVKINEATSGKADLSTVQAVDDKFVNYYTSAQVDDAISTAIDELDIPSAISDLTNDSEFATSAQVSSIVEGYGYITDAALTAYATSGWVDQNYAKKGEAPTDVYTKAEVDQISSALSSTVSGAGYITEIPTSYVQEDAISDMATQTWVGEQGFLTEVPNNYATKTDVDNAISAMATTGWVSEQGYLTEVPNTYALKTDIPTDAETYEAISGDIEAQITGKNYITSDALNGLASDEDLQYVSGIVSVQAEDITALKAVSGEVDYETVFDMLSSGDTDTLTITKDTTNQKIVLTATGGGSGGKTYTGDNGIEVDNVNDTISISANFLSANALEGYATQSWVGQQGFALTSQLPTDYTTSAQVSSIVEGYDFATTSEIPTTVAELTDASDYALKSELPSNYTTSAQVSSIVTGYNYLSSISIRQHDPQTQEQSYLSAAGLDFNDNFTVYKGYNDDYATIEWKGLLNMGGVQSTEEFYAKIIQWSSDFDVWQDEGGVYVSLTPLSTSQITNDSDYQTAAQVSAIASGYAATGGITSAQVSAIVEGYDYATESFVTGQGYITDASLTDYAQLSDIPSVVSDLTNDANYISAITLSAYNASTMQNEAVQTTTIALASTDFVTWNGTVYINDNKFDIPTDSEISGIASAVASTYIEGSTISAVSQLINDVGFVTEPRVSAIASAYAEGGGGTTYTAGSGITIDNGTIKTNLVAGSNVTFSVNDNAVTINAAGGTSSNKQSVYTVNGAIITYNSQYEIFKTTYTGGDVTLNAVTVTTSQVGNGEVATFEEWITFSSSVSSLSEGTNTLIGEWPDTIDNSKTHVIVRRLVNNNGTIVQYVSYAYNF